jgi:hypothetical protein
MLKDLGEACQYMKRQAQWRPFVTICCFKFSGEPAKELTGLCKGFDQPKAAATVLSRRSYQGVRRVHTEGPGPGNATRVPITYNYHKPQDRCSPHAADLNWERALPLVVVRVPGRQSKIKKILYYRAVASELRTHVFSLTRACFCYCCCLLGSSRGRSVATRRSSQVFEICPGCGPTILFRTLLQICSQKLETWRTRPTCRSRSPLSEHWRV